MKRITIRSRWQTDKYVGSAHCRRVTFRRLVRAEPEHVEFPVCCPRPTGNVFPQTTHTCVLGVTTHSKWMNPKAEKVSPTPRKFISSILSKEQQNRLIIRWNLMIHLVDWPYQCSGVPVCICKLCDYLLIKLLLRLFAQIQMSVLKTTEDAVIMLGAAILKVALYADVTTASQEMDSPAAKVCRRQANFWRPYTTGTSVCLLL